MQFARIARFALRSLAVAALVGLPDGTTAQTAGAYTVTNLISDGSVPALLTDPNFIDPWGMSVSPTWWISANGSGMNFVVSPTAPTISFKVVVPNPAGSLPGLPTGSVTTSGATGMLLPNGTKASFIFSTDDGTISGWNSKLGTAGAISQIVVNNAAANADYTGLAILNTGTASYLLAPNFGAAAKVEVYDSTFKLTQLPGTFTDPNLGAGYAPYSIHVIGTQIFVAFTPRANAPPYNEILGPGNGVVDSFDTNGNFVARIAGGGNLNAPWGVAIAPATFGIYSNDILIGNFGDGLINVFDPKTFAYLGQMIDGSGKAMVYPSLWDLLPGNTPVSGGSVGTVYFTAGLVNEQHGLLAGISNSTASGPPAFGMSTQTPTLAVPAGSSVSTMVSISPAYNFSGTVTLGCKGLPASSVCTFSPASLLVSGSAPSTGTVTILTTKASAALATPTAFRGLAFAALLPMFSLLLFRRRSVALRGLRLLAILLLLAGSASLISGCSDASLPGKVVATPAGSQTITITATAGSLSRQVSLNLNVQ